jgi:hypothetical protein
VLATSFWSRSPFLKLGKFQSSVIFLQDIVIVRVDALLLDPTQDIFELFTCHKLVIGIVL